MIYEWEKKENIMKNKVIAIDNTGQQVTAEMGFERTRDAAQNY
jgi:hypothetical protein